MEIYPLNHEINNNWCIINHAGVFTNKLRLWIEENVKDDWAKVHLLRHAECIVYFKNETDAVAFKLRWA